jgi:hypothetical protein
MRTGQFRIPGNSAAKKRKRRERRNRRMKDEGLGAGMRIDDGWKDGGV